MSSPPGLNAHSKKLRCYLIFLLHSLTYTLQAAFQVKAQLWLLPLFFLISGKSSVTAITTLPAGFQESIVISGLTAPTDIRFAPDGRVFVVERSGKIKIFNSLTDTTPDVLIDLSTNVDNVWDRGMLGFAIHPQFPAQPYVFVFYTYDFDPFFIGPQPPRWGDGCPTPPGSTADGCVVNGRLSRLQVAANNTLMGSEQVLLENNWCQQYPSHSIGGLYFGPEGALYLSAGDGASFTFTDYGQKGVPKNPCDDPPVARGQVQVPPTAEGGALRAQDLRTSGDPVSFDGAILRLDPDTGQPWPNNPLMGGNTGDDRIIAYGLRNPFRFTIRPGTSEVWIGDVGWNTWEEINRIPNPITTPIRNFGWPCYEGVDRQGGYDSINLNICENLYAAGTAIPPYYTYNHSEHVDPNGDACPTGSSSISGLAFYTSGAYPSTYQGALFFADYSRRCIYMMRKGTNGNPDVNTRTAFAVNAASPVDLEIGPGGDLYYADLNGGNIRRITFLTANQPPTAVADANPLSGSPPLNVQFDASGSTDPNPGATLFYDWDLDGDSQFDDSTLVNPTFTYTTAGQRTIGLRVTDDHGATDTDQVTIIVGGNNAPSATITSPQSSFTWKVGDAISFSGSGSDPETGLMPASTMQWQIILHHCDSAMQNCHTHALQTFNGIKQGTFVAPDHEWYSYLEIKLTVTDPGGLEATSSVSITPKSVLLTFKTNPTGLSLGVGSSSQTTPFTREVIVNSTNSLNAPLSQTLGGTSYSWSSWSQGGAANQEIKAPATSSTYTANYLVNSAPTVSLTAPANGANFTPPASLTINATASDSNGTISKVQFFRGSTLLGTDTTSPYSFAWNNVAAGNYALTAKATDNNGAVTTSSAVNITVNNPPAVSITAPATGATIPAPANITINASASDTGGTIAKVQFFHGSTLLGTDTTSPYSFAWNNVAAGSYSLTAKATDNLGTVTTSSAVNITVSSGPKVSITAPQNGATLTEHTNITIHATASGISGSISKVEFFRGTTRIGEDKTSPYSFAWNDVHEGTYSLTAKATNNLGETTSSSPVNITVNAPPTVSITAPANGAIYIPPANIIINATASDTGGSISKVEFFRGTTKLGQDTTSPYSFSWSNVAVGSYSLTAKATDNQGATKTSKAVNITVNAPPTVSITAPANGAAFTEPANITIHATAADTGGSISKVEFFQGTKKLGEDKTSPYSFAWDNVHQGTYSLTAKATDNQDTKTTSSAVNIIVNPPPTVSFTSPENGATFTARAKNH